MLEPARLESRMMSTQTAGSSFVADLIETAVASDVTLFVAVDSVILPA